MKADSPKNRPRSVNLSHIPDGQSYPIIGLNAEPEDERREDRTLTYAALWAR